MSAVLERPRARRTTRFDPRRQGYVYLIHFDEGLPIREGKNGPVCARHYIGWSNTAKIKQRLDHHAKGTGSALMRAVSKQGIPWRVVRLWKGSRDDERRIKNRREAPRFCPVCVEQDHDHRGLQVAHVPEVDLAEVFA